MNELTKNEKLLMSDLYTQRWNEIDALYSKAQASGNTKEMQRYEKAKTELVNMMVKLGL